MTGGQAGFHRDPRQVSQNCVSQGQGAEVRPIAATQQAGLPTQVLLAAHMRAGPPLTPGGGGGVITPAGAQGVHALAFAGLPTQLQTRFYPGH